MGKSTSCHLSRLTECGRHAFNVLLDLEDNNWTIRTFIQLPDGVEPQITPEELNQADEAVRRDANVIKFAAEVGVTASQIRADGWSIGYDDRFGKETPPAMHGLRPFRTPRESLRAPIGLLSRPGLEYLQRYAKAEDRIAL
jgi:Cu2+-containing amine oxidase